jgi:tetratricopeptide (TPR) repeat protein
VEAEGPAAPAAEFPEPQAESPEPAASDESALGGNAAPEDEAAEPALSSPEPGPGGSKTAGEAARLPVPRPPAEQGKAADKSKPASASQPLKGAKAPAAASAAPTKPAQAASTPSPGTAADKPRAPEPREVLARKGDAVVIELEGRGWLFVPGERRGVSFLGSETGPQRTVFSFKALELGDFELAFQLQDNARGAASSEVVRLRVLPEDKLRELLAAPPKSGAPGQAAPATTPLTAGSPPMAGYTAAPEPVDPVRLEKAERLYAGGFYDLALPEYLAIYREADPLLNDRLAGIYLAKGDAAAAAKYYDRNLSAAAPYGRKAVIGLVRAGLAMDSPELVLQHLPAMLELPPAQTQTDLLDVARFAASRKSYALALELLTEYLRRHPRGAGLDSAYFQLAQLYELESPLRDVRLAREYYRIVYEDFPESEHAAESRSRILYLDRHFFHVQ